MTPKRKQAASGLPALPAAAYPHLRQFLRGYLNQDVLPTYGGPAAAAVAFRDDADASQLRALRKELERLQKTVQPMSLEDLNAALALLGSSWVFRSREEFLSLVETLHGQPSGR
ncbi:MAG TPA: contact-dependent growth inhibition system immunity protein [Terriglobales bacterium]|nr:contact-dependent growth inhibition system immunity protein [Terriglobales bacterium]